MKLTKFISVVLFILIPIVCFSQSKKSVAKLVEKELFSQAVLLNERADTDRGLYTISYKFEESPKIFQRQTEAMVKKHLSLNTVGKWEKVDKYVTVVLTYKDKYAIFIGYADIIGKNLVAACMIFEDEETNIVKSAK